jgi:SP family sugar porter-like MFS transporter
MSDQISSPAEVSGDINPKYNMGFIWRICLVAAMGGLLFGYDWVVIGGAKPFFIQFFGLQDNLAMVGWAMSSALVGCLAGSIISGALSDKFGRKRLLILSGLLFTISAIGTGLANSFSAFVAYRVLGGIGIGLASNLSPMYIAELSPASMRGKFVSINQLTIVTGVVTAQIINWAIAKNMPADFTDQQILESWYGRVGWRWMFAAETIPAFLFFVLMFVVPESPRWLVKNAKDKQAQDILTKVGGAEYASFEVTDIKNTLAREIQRVNFKDLFEPKLMKIIFIGIVLATFQQWCGINVIFYYAADIFKAAGYDVKGVMLNIVITGTVMLLFTFIAIGTVDRFGRKILMLIGSAGLTISYALVGYSFSSASSGFVVVLVVLAIAFYSFSLAPITWVLLSELFPNRIRGAAMSISVFTLWLTCWALAQIFPIMNDKLGPAGSFWVFGGICLFGFIYILKVLPETKQKTLEEIERELVD